ncbi:AT hook motif-containing protein, putative [Theobroma cacao]|uniref:AT hook motif-containing protein, putative n=1 Tax=Theobroma cacao TaxID=3641 RepID=A0A061F4V0_THECC|nr:AT hook motif-containing protein, putative [Theobroma cacao]
MNQENDQENNPDASTDVPLKRKRGRPRKFPKHNLYQGENAQTARNQNPNRAENIRIPPLFERVNGNQPLEADPINDANDVMVGQAVYGVIEAAFDAGYLLTVRVGNSDTTLRGVVFKPGHYVPVSAENDVAPNVQMIRRNEIPFPRGRNEQHVNSHRNGTAHPFNEPGIANHVPGARASNLGGSKSNHVQSVATQSASPLTRRGNLVPVVLQPASVPYGGSVANQPSLVASQPAHLVASKGKQVSEAAHTSNMGTPTNQMPTFGNKIYPTQPPAEVLQETEAKSMTMPGMPFEKLLTEVMKRIQVPQQQMDGQGGNLSVKDSGHDMEDEQPLSIEPLQAVQPAHSSSMLKPFDNFRTGKMTELLQAVQENMRETQASRTEEPATSSGETDQGDKEMHDSNRHSQVKEPNCPWRVMTLKYKRLDGIFFA